MDIEYWKARAERAEMAAHSLAEDRDRLELDLARALTAGRTYWGMAHHEDHRTEPCEALEIPAPPEGILARYNPELNKWMYPA